LFEGGQYHFVGSSANNPADDHYWWYGWGSNSNSYSWARSNDLYKFLLWTYPGGVPYGPWGPAQSGNPYTPDQVVTGDLIFYDFDSNGLMEHVSIQVGWGTDPTLG